MVNWTNWEIQIEKILCVHLDEDNGIERLQHAIETRHDAVSKALSLPLSRDDFNQIEESTQRLKRLLLMHRDKLQQRLKRQQQQEHHKLLAYRDYQNLGRK